MVESSPAPFVFSKTQIPRPPTPPRQYTSTGSKNRVDFSEELSLQLDNPLSSDTYSPNASPIPISSSQRKRVGWSKFFAYECPDVTIKPLTPSRERKSSKSILKPSASISYRGVDDPNPLFPEAHSYVDVATMLQPL